MANKSSHLVSDIHRAKGLGASHEGTHHWLMQRVTALSNLALELWLVYSIVSLKGATLEMFTAWLAQPWNALPMILFVMSTFYHATLGLQVIIEDYTTTRWLKMMMIIGSKLLFTVLGVVCIFSVLKIAL